MGKNAAAAIWFQLSIIPFAIAILRYSLLLDRGEGSEPGRRQPAVPLDSRRLANRALAAAAGAGPGCERPWRAEPDLVALLVEDL